ncbi:hypothetical protein IFM89_028460 [Coptis chinensis]|uniref:Uncharacterized protein n=1 Tax=Coptis chinensis TaxID=261450 RepID=A0A835IT93_9MAGN|nr:hypothetical protein IFM89_028460 [Coptis chinensis]
MVIYNGAMDRESRRWRYAYSSGSRFGEMESAKTENCGIELLTLVIHLRLIFTSLPVELKICVFANWSSEFTSMAPFLKKFCPSVYQKEMATNRQINTVDSTM